MEEDDINYLRKNKKFSKLRIIFGALSKKRKCQILLLYITMIFTGFAEVFLLGSFIPLLAFINNPNQIGEIKFLKIYTYFFDVNDYQNIIFPLLLSFLVIVFFATIIKITNIWLIETLAGKVAGDLSNLLYKKTIYKSYENHLKLNSSKTINTITIHITKTMNGCKVFLSMCSAFIIISIMSNNNKYKT